MEIRPTDYKFGDNKIVFKAVIQTGDWSNHMWFNETQLLLDGQDTDDCVPFSVQESFDMQMDALISNGTIPIELVNSFTTLGYMDSVNSTDKLPHFHSSPRFLGIMTGNKQNGNSTQEVYDVLRQYGTLPYTDLPPNVDTAAEYYAPATAAQLAKAAQFLALLGGKNAVLYHALNQGSPKNMAQIAQALQQAPLQAGVAVAANWNQTIPSPDPAEGATPEHCVSIYKQDGLQLPFEDHYVPFLKTFDAGYPINWISQVVVIPIIQEVAPIVNEVAQIVPEIAEQPPAEQPKLIQVADEIIKDIEEILA